MPEVSDRASTGNQARSTRASALEQHCTVIKGVGPPPGGGQPSQRELDSQTESAAGLCSVLVAAEGFGAGLSGQRRDASLPPARRTCRLTPPNSKSGPDHAMCLHFHHLSPPPVRPDALPPLSLRPGGKRKKTVKAADTPHTARHTHTQYCWVLSYRGPT